MTAADITAVSIIIPTFNRSALITRTLDSLLSQNNIKKDQFEIIIVDNHSTDNTRIICEDYIRAKSGFQLNYQYEDVPGLLAARHTGARAAKGEVLTYIDDDIIAGPNWLQTIIKTFGDEKVLLLGGKNLPEFEGRVPEWLDDMWQTIEEGRVLGQLSLMDLGETAKEIRPGLVWGLNFSIRKDFFFKMGGFNPDSFPKAYQKFQGDGESGLGIKLAELGIKANYHPEVLIKHIIPEDRLTIEYFKRRMYFQGYCDSYSRIRKTGGTEFIPEINNVQIESNNRFSVLKGKVKNLFPGGKTVNTGAITIEMVKREMKIAYRKGFADHQELVFREPELLRWIIKENYLDCGLPIEQLIVTEKPERSY